MKRQLLNYCTSNNPIQRVIPIIINNNVSIYNRNVNIYNIWESFSSFVT